MARTGKLKRNGKRLEFQEKLLAWYDVHARDLPWRKDRDPYRVWVSEIMLQQTRVAAVLSHYREFLRRFPSVRKLAVAKESAVLAAWSGLGYYRRARMMHAAAKKIVRERKGRFPQNSEEWRELPGIGRYTAAAIASIAFGEPIAVVDGNVERVLQRFAGRPLPAREIWLAAEDLLDRKRPGDFNQALMELGATVCSPRTPACLVCPVATLCVSRGELPLRLEASRQVRRTINYALDCHQGKIFLIQRPAHANLMAGMWELPEIHLTQTAAKPAFKLRHSITVTDYAVRIWKEPAPTHLKGNWIPLKRLHSLPLTGLARKTLSMAGLLSKPQN